MTEGELISKVQSRVKADLEVSDDSRGVFIDLMKSLFLIYPYVVTSTQVLQFLSELRHPKPSVALIELVILSSEAEIRRDFWTYSDRVFRPAGSHMKLFV